MIRRASALASLVAFQAAGAQSTGEVRLDAGAAQVQQTGRVAHDAAGVFGLAWSERSPVFSTLLFVSATVAGDSTSAAQGGLAAAWRPAERSPWQTDGAVSAAAFGSTPLARGGSVATSVRERFAIGAGGIWGGAALGSTARDASSSHSTAVDVGGWWHWGDLEASASASRLRSDDFNLLEAAGIFVSGNAAAYDLVDLATDLKYEHGPFTVGATGTWRNGTRATTINQSAVFLSAGWAATARYSILVGTGRLLADPVRGIPDMQITSVALRIALVQPRAAGAPGALRGASFVTLIPKSSGAVLVVRVVAADSSQVDVAGSFSDWRPVPLTRTAGGWEAEIALPPGRHRVAVRFEGGPWQAPRGTARVKDDFGGEAGLIVVP